MTVQKPNLIVSTCGTSLLTNGADQDMRRLLGEHANAKENDIAADERRQIDKRADERREQLKSANDDEAAKLSAEINGLLAYYRDPGIAARATDQDHHYLVVTDTYVGNHAFRCIDAWLKRKYGERTIVEKITKIGLNTSEFVDFRAALTEIGKHFADELPNWQKNGNRVVFNLTGGFKSVSGFMQTIGMLFADECFYLFEGSQQIMRIPRLPIKLDAASSIEENLRAVRRMANEETLSRTECGKLDDTLLYVVSEHEIQLSEWGGLLWAKERRRIYGKELMEPLSDGLDFSDKFKRQIKKRAGILTQDDRLYTLNCRLDDLARYMISNPTCNPNSLDFKAIKGNPKPGITHEFAVWSDLSNRGYGHYENHAGLQKFVVEEIGGHL